MAIKCGHCQEHHDTVADVRACSQKTKGEWLMGSAPPPVNREVAEGMWYLDHTRIIKVQRAVHGSGQLYTKELVQDDADSWGFDILRGGIKMLMTDPSARKMTLEEAVQFGKLYGVCCSCGRMLTNELSIELGIGPVCREKF